MKCLFVAIACASMSVASAQGPALDLLDNLVVTDSKAYALLPPQMLAGGNCKRVSYSPDGRYVLVDRVKPPEAKVLQDLLGGNPPADGVDTGTSELLAYNIKTGKSTVVLSAPNRGLTFEMTGWFAKSSVAVVSAMAVGPTPDRSFSLFVVDAARGTARESFRSDSAHVIFSATQPNAAIVEFVKKGDGSFSGQTAIQRLVPDGRLSNPVVLPGSLPSVFEEPGGTWACQERLPHGAPKGTVAPAYRIDFTSATCTQVGAVTKLIANESNPALLVVAGSGPVTISGRKTYARAAYITPTPTDDAKPNAEPPIVAVLGTDVKESWLSPNLDSVTYISRGSAFIRPVIELPREAALLAYRAARQNAVMNQGKQCGLGAMMLASDYDDVLPGPEDFSSKVMPYLKDQGMLENFTYTFGGGNLRDIKDPASTELGFVPGPNGRAVVFVDGHVRWVPDH